MTTTTPVYPAGVRSPKPSRLPASETWKTVERTVDRNFDRMRMPKPGTYRRTRFVGDAPRSSLVEALLDGVKAKLAMHGGAGHWDLIESLQSDTKLPWSYVLEAVDLALERGIITANVSAISAEHVTTFGRNSKRPHHNDEVALWLELVPGVVAAEDLRNEILHVVDGVAR